MDRATCLPERFARQAGQSSQGRWITTIFLMWVNALSIDIGMPGRALCAALLTAKWQNLLSTWKFMTAFTRPSGKIMKQYMKIAGSRKKVACPSLELLPGRRAKLRRQESRELA